jgi:hypothetical protein
LLTALSVEFFESTPFTVKLSPPDLVCYRPTQSQNGRSRNERHVERPSLNWKGSLRAKSIVWAGAAVLGLMAGVGFAGSSYNSSTYQG